MLFDVSKSVLILSARPEGCSVCAEGLVSQPSWDIARAQASKNNDVNKQPGYTRAYGPITAREGCYRVEEERAQESQRL